MEVNTTAFPVYGLPGRQFYVLHVSCIAALVISIRFSSGVLWTLAPDSKFFSRDIGNRLVVYLATCDLVFSLSLLVDQIYMITNRTHTPTSTCQVLGFLIHVSFIGQTLVVVFAAINALVSVRRHRPITVGIGDWRLHVYVLVIPAVTGILIAGIGYFGPSGAWCYIDRSKPLSSLIYNLFSIMLTLTFIFCIICYSGVWVKIRKVSHGAGSNCKYKRTAKIMSLFVLAYLLQWWGAVVFGIWSMFGEPHFIMTSITICCNSLGGMHNFFAYTFMRRRFQAQPINVDHESITRTNHCLETFEGE